MSTIPMSDINYLAPQSSERLNLILSGMTALMNDTDEKVSIMESQNWFQRMIKTVSGKNKMTQSEIEQNHDKLNAYMSEAIAELYNRDCIDHSVIISLGTQLNEIYADHLQLKNMLGSFVAKLNEKINSVDNFHMLTTEIDQGIYTCKNDIYSICNVLSQFDSRMLNDERKLDIIRRSLENQQILSDKAIPLVDYLMDVIEIPMDNAGKIYLELSTIRDNFMVDVFLSTMDAYYFLSDMTRKMKSKQLLVHDIIAIKGLNDAVLISTNEIYNEFLMSKVAVVGNLSINASAADIGDRKAEKSQDGENLQEPTWNASKALEQNVIEEQEVLQQAEQMFFDCKLDEAFEIFSSLAESGNGRAMYFLGEYYYHQYGHVARDLKESKKWRMKGYEAGDSLATLNACRYLEDDSAERKQVLENVAQSVYHLAKSGDVYAQNELSDMYFYGHGIEKNEKEGWNWLKKSAEEGYWRAIYKMGELYRNGTYIVKDKEEAKKWYKKGMEKGDAYSYLGMARCTIGNYHFLFGRDQMSLDVLLGLKRIDSIRFELQGKLEKVMKEVLDFCMESYKRGCGEAAFMSARMYDSFVNVLFGNFEYDKAFLWAGKAAEMGCEEGLFYLGYCYYWGRGTDQNYQLAQKYYKLASEQGYNDATIMLGIMALENQNDADAKRWFYLAKKNGSVVSNAVKLLCEIFKRKHKESVFKYSSKLKDTLNIKNNDRIYLSHDDSGLKNGKYGFIIAESGIYSKDFEFLLSVPANYVSYDKLAKYSGIRVEDNNCTVYADDKFLSYFSGGDKERLDVIELMRNIKLIANIYKE